MSGRRVVGYSDDGDRHIEIDYYVPCNLDGHFHGTTATYMVHPSRVPDGFNVQGHICDYDLSPWETFPKQTRAARLRRKRAGKKPQKLPEHAFDGDIFVLVGPKTSPKRAVAALQRLILSIERNGLLIGRDEKGDHIWE